MSNNRELLELAAKAVGFVGTVTEYTNGYVDMSLSNHFNPSGSNIWNPLHVSGHALRLAVDLNIDVYHAPAFEESQAGFYVSGFVLQQTKKVKWDDDKHKATRRAIVLAAAEIGKGTE